MSARAARRAAERDRLDLLAAEEHSRLMMLTVEADVVDDFLAGLAFERQRTRLVWRRRAPEWLQLTAGVTVALLGFAAVYLMLLALSLTA